jgi:hypothetical protein
MRRMQAGDDLDAGAPQGSLWQHLAPAPGRPWPERAAATLLFTVAYLAAVAAVVWIQGYTFVYGNVAVSVPQVLALTDPTLFRNDLCHQSVLAASPRIYINGLVALTAKLGVTDVPGAYFLWFVVSVASYVAGCLAIGTRVSSRAAGALLAFLGVAATKATIGSVDILHQHRHFEPAMLAMGLSVWGIYFVLGKRFTTGFAMFGVAALFQFLVGFIPGALIAPALGVLALKERNAWTLLRPMLPFAAGLGAVYLPMALAGATSTKVPDDVFVFLYAHVRNPHHVSPAAWPPVAWQELVLFSLGGVACVLGARTLSRLQRGVLISIIGCTWLGLLANWYFVDIAPNAFVAKLQLARCTPFAKLAVLVALSALAADCFERGLGGLGLLLVLTALNPFRSWHLLIASLIASLAARFGPARVPAAVRAVSWAAGAAALIFYLGGDAGGFAKTWALYQRVSGPRFAEGPLLFAMLAAPVAVTAAFALRRRWLRVGLASLVALAVCVSAYQVARPRPKLARALTHPVHTQWQPRSAVERVAFSLRQTTPPDAVVLVPPAFESFQIHSHRAAVVTFKCIPLGEAELVEWGKRMARVLGVPTGVQTSWRGDLDGPYYRRSADDLRAVAREYGARYLLTKTGAHPGLVAPVVAAEGGFVVYDLGS